jgi:hypothetical protein
LHAGNRVLPRFRRGQRADDEWRRLAHRSCRRSGVVPMAVVLGRPRRYRRARGRLLSDRLCRRNHHPRRVDFAPHEALAERQGLVEIGWSGASTPITLAGRSAGPPPWLAGIVRLVQHAFADTAGPLVAWSRQARRRCTGHSLLR